MNEGVDIRNDHSSNQMPGMIDHFSLENCDHNITMLDKIYEYEKVAKHFVKLQLQYLNYGKPIEFLIAPILDINLLN